MDHSQHDCLLVAVLTHGDLGILYATDGTYKTDSIWANFTSDKCPTLAGKPKIFLIEACQGNKHDNGVTLKKMTENDDDPSTNSIRIPTSADFLIAYSSSPGYVSYCNTKKGSWFTQTLCTELKKNGTRYDLLTLLPFVCQRVAIDRETPLFKSKQMPFFTSTLTRLIKFDATKK